MSMSDEQLQKTGILRMIMDKQNSDDEEESIVERIEMFEDKIDYLDISNAKKEKLRDLAIKIKAEDNPKVQEFLFKELVKMVQDD